MFRHIQPAANRNELTGEVRVAACQIVDTAARDWVRVHAKLALPVAKTARSRNTSDNESNSNEVSANSDYSDYSEDDENSVETAVIGYTANL